MKFEITKPERHIKNWGWEDWLINNEQFCGKILHFNKGAKFSAHFHGIKNEVQYLHSGKMILRYIDGHNAAQLEREINVGDVINIPRFQVHQLEAIEESEIFEVSSQHFEEDSYRVLPGDSQK